MNEPNHSATASDVLIGTCTFGNNAGKRLTIETNDLAKHLLAIGATGSGKTVVLKAVCESLIAKQIPIVAIDVLGDILGLAIPAENLTAYTSRQLPAPPGLSADDWTMGQAVARRLQQSIHARYLTPCSDVGERISISPLPMRMPNVIELLDRDRDDIELQASTAAWALMGRIGMKQPRDGVGGQDELVRNLLQESILRAWEMDADLEGVEGIQLFQHLVNGLVGSQMPGKLLQKFFDGMTSLTKGQSVRWLEGMRLDWDTLLKAPNGKTPLVVIGIEHLPREHYPWIVSQIINSLATWCSNQAPAAGRLRCGLMVDELKGEGGRLSLLPPLTYTSPSGHAIRRVLRMGRHWGLGFFGGTQSPRDVDSRNFSQFNTRFVGKLTNSYDVRVALEGASMNEKRAKRIGEYIKGSSAPRMFYIRPDGTYESVNVRWLGTLHSRLPKERITELYQQQLLYRAPVAPRPIVRPERVIRSGWVLKAHEIRDPRDRAVLCLDLMSDHLTLLGQDGQVTTASASDPHSLIAMATKAGQSAALAGVRLCVFVESADIQRRWTELMQSIGVTIPGWDQPWYLLAPLAEHIITERNPDFEDDLLSANHALSLLGVPFAMPDASRAQVSAVNVLLRHFLDHFALPTRVTPSHVPSTSHATSSSVSSSIEPPPPPRTVPVDADDDSDESDRSTRRSRKHTPQSVIATDVAA